MGELKIKTEWDLSPLTKGKSFEEKRRDWQEATDNFVKKWKNREDYIQDPKILKEALDDYENWQKNFGAEADEIVYYWLKTQLDQNDPELKAKFLKAEEFSKKIENEVSFFELKAAKIPKEKQKEFLEFRGLKVYGHFLERLFAEAKHLLSENEEKIMNLKSTSSYSSWVKMLSGFLAKEESTALDEDGNEAKKTFQDLLSMTENRNKELRDRAAGEIDKILEKYSDVAEAEINAILEDKKVNDELRGFKRPDAARHIADDIESNIVDSLVGTVSKNMDISRKFYELKTKLLGLKKLQYHERNVSYGSVNKNYEYKKSAEIIYNVFEDLDEEFGGIFKRLIENGQVDAFPKKGKKEGAFCSYMLKTRPTYIMLNHSGTIDDVRTIAHEMGHAINGELMKKQNSLNFGTPLSTAEVASTFMEDFVTRELAKDSDDETKLAIMMDTLNREASSIMRQIACYRFEKQLHRVFREKGYLSKSEIGEIFQGHMKEYMGDSVDVSKAGNWWIYWGHIRNYFYNYSYASGMMISKALQNMVKADRNKIADVKQFLSSGLSKSPKEVFMNLGIDISKKEFWEKSMKELRELLGETEALAKRLGKI